MSGISTIIIFGIENRLVLLKSKFLNLSDQVHNPHGIKILTRLGVRLSHFCEHKFRHNF